MDQLKALVVAANFQLVVKIPLEVCILGGHGHHQAENDSWKLRTIVTTAKVCYEDNIHNNGQQKQAEKINHVLLYH